MACVTALPLILAVLALTACHEPMPPAGKSHFDPSAKADDPGARQFLGSAGAVLINPALFDVLDQVQRSWGDVPLDQRQLAIAAVSESSDGATTRVRMRLDAAPANRFPASYATVGVLEATIVDDVMTVDLIDADLPEGEPLPPSLAALFGAPSYRQRIRSLLEEDPELQLTDAREVSDSIGAAVVAQLRGGTAGSSTATRYELVARFSTPPESAPKVQSVAAYRDGVIADLRVVDYVDAWQIFPGNGYLAYDDAKALTSFWSGYGKLTGGPVPYVGPGETVLGFVTHYFSLTAKDMSLEVIDDTGAEVVVNVTITWNGFACFEHTGRVDLYNLVKLRSGGRPIVVNVYADTGKPCDTGMQLPDLPPKLVHELRIEPESRNRMTLCESTGKFNDAPFGTDCRVVDSLSTD